MNGARSLIEKRVDVLLWAVIIVAACVHMAVPFYDNPMHHLVSDMDRHFGGALILDDDQPMSILDPVGYQFCLGSILRVARWSDPMIAFYCGLLSTFTPFAWYLWLKECLPSSRLALIGYALISILPAWIMLYSYFMPETVLLPATALALWLTWKTSRHPDVKHNIFTALSWGAASCIKASVMPLAVCSMIWLLARKTAQPARRRVLILIAVFVCFSFMYLQGPIKIYTRSHAVVLMPPGDFIRLGFEGAGRVHEITLKMLLAKDGFSRPHEYHLNFVSPSVGIPTFFPFSSWTGTRSGTFNDTIDYTQPPSNYYQKVAMTFPTRLRMTAENIAYFFFAPQWPQEDLISERSQLLAVVRWLWFPLTLATIFLSCRKRSVNALLIIFWLYTLSLMFQQFNIMEGRYRAPWEGVAIGAALSVMALPKRSRS